MDECITTLTYPKKNSQSSLKLPLLLRDDALCQPDQHIRSAQMYKHTHPLRTLSHLCYWSDLNSMEVQLSCSRCLHALRRGTRRPPSTCSYNCKYFHFESGGGSHGDRKRSNRIVTLIWLFTVTGSRHCRRC